MSPSSNLELTGATGGFRVTLPGAVPGATHVNIYLSEANGAIPRLLATVAVGTATYDCVALPTGRQNNGRFEQPLPEGRLFFSNNRLCSIVGSDVFVGEPYRYGYCRFDCGMDRQLRFNRRVSGCSHLRYQQHDPGKDRHCYF